MSLSHSTGLSNTSTDAGFGPAFDGSAGTVKLDILSGAVPSAAAVGGKSASANGADAGTVLATFTLSAADVFAAAANGGATAINGTPLTVAASATGTAAHFAIRRTGDTALSSAALAADRRLNGTVGTSASDMTIDNTSINSGQNVTLSAWTWTGPV